MEEQENDSGEPKRDCRRKRSDLKEDVNENKVRHHGDEHDDAEPGGAPEEDEETDDDFDQAQNGLVDSRMAVERPRQLEAGELSEWGVFPIFVRVELPMEKLHNPVHQHEQADEIAAAGFQSGEWGFHNGEDRSQLLYSLI